MSSIVISGDTSGSVTLDAPAVAGSTVLTLPVGTGVISANGVSSNIVAATAQASTSGTSIDFTGIPSWVKRITVMINGVSLSGTSNILIQLGTSGGVTSTGYNNYGMSFGISGGAGTGYTNGFGFRGSVAASIYSGNVSITNLNSNIWTAFGGIGYATSTDGSMTMGGVSLAATLDRVRITTVNGTDTFDAGSINILYE
jgi:hypothetical protein